MPQNIAVSSPEWGSTGQEDSLTVGLALLCLCPDLDVKIFIWWLPVCLFSFGLLRSPCSLLRRFSWHFQCRSFIRWLSRPAAGWLAAEGALCGWASVCVVPQWIVAWRAARREMAVMTTYPSRSSAMGSQTRRFFNFRCSTQMYSDLVADGNAAVENPAGWWFDEKAPRSSVRAIVCLVCSRPLLFLGVPCFLLSPSLGFSSLLHLTLRPPAHSRPHLPSYFFLKLAWVARLSALILLLHVLFSLSISPLVRLLSHHSKGSPIDSPSFFGEALRRSQCPVLSVSWFVPTQVSYLMFLSPVCLVVSISLTISRSAAHPILDVPCIRFRTCCVTQKNSDGGGSWAGGIWKFKAPPKKKKA